MTANRVSVYISVEDVEKAVAAFNTVNNAVTDSGIVIDRSYSESRKSILDLTGATKEAAKAQGEVERAAGQTARSVRNEYVSFLQFEQSLAQNARSANAALEYNDTAVNKLRASLRATQSEAQKLQGELARQGNAGASRTAADLARSAGRGLDAIDNDPSSLLRVDAFTRGSAKGTLTALKEEARGFNAETTKSVGLLKFLQTEIKGVGSPLAGIVGGLVGGSLITAAIGLVVELGQKYVKAYEEAKKSQESLLRTSVATGSSIYEQIDSVNALKASYSSLSETAVRDLQAIALEASKLPTTEQTIRQRLEANQKGNLFGEDARQALRSLSDVEISRAAASTGILRGVSSADLTKAAKDYFAGQTQTLSGIGDEEIQGRFASEIGKLPSSFNEEEKRLARLSFLVKEATRDYGSAKDAIQTFRDSLSQPSNYQPTWITQFLAAKGVDTKTAVQLDKGVSDYFSGTPAPPSQASSAYLQLRTDLQKSQQENAAQSLQRLLQNQTGDEQFKKIREEASKNFAENAAKEAQAAEAAMKKVAEIQKQTFQHARTQADSLFQSLAQHRGKNNPYVNIFSEARQAAESFNLTAKNLRAQFGDAADDVIKKLEGLTKARRDALAEQALEQRVNDSLTAFDLQQEAKRFRQPTAQKAAKDARVDAAKQPLPQDSTFIPQTAAHLRDYLTSIDATGALRGKNFYAAPDSEFARAAARGTAAQRFGSNFYAGADSPFAPRKPIEPFEAPTAATASDAAREAQARLARLDEATRGGGDAASALNDRKTLEFLRGMRPEDLTPELKRRGAGAAERESERVLNREQDALKSQEAERELRQELIEVLHELVKELRSGGKDVNINIDENGRVNTDVLGKSPKADDYTGQRGVRRPGDVM